MRRLFLALAMFALAAGVNSASVAWQQRTRVFTRRFGRRGWYVHLALIIPPWLGFFLALPGLSRAVRWSLPQRLRPLGWPILGAALTIWLLAYAKLGLARTANASVFERASQEPVTGGIYRWLREPMYDSYALAFVGQALLSANAVYLLLAAESFVLLNLVEARVERLVVRQNEG